MSVLGAPDKPRILVVTTDPIGGQMAGPAIRSWEIAKALSKVADVRLLTTEAAYPQKDAFPTYSVDDASLREHIEWAEVLVFSGGFLYMFPWIAETDLIIVADVYDPFHLEALELSRESSATERDEFVAAYVRALNFQLERADFFICASEKQRDLWLGHLGALGRINPYTYDTDRSLRNLVDVAPFGVSESSPISSRRAIKGSVPGIDLDDKVILWGGGIYNWFDPLTLIRSISLLIQRRPNVRLFFLGVTHPNPKVPKMRMAAEAMSLADHLGLTNQHVFFNSDWVEYEDRINYLLDADVGVSTHFPHVETSFSYRTRILDYLWAGLPIVATGGDTFADVITGHQLGRVVPPENPEDLAKALELVIFGNEHSEMSKNARKLGQSMTWSRALEPLTRFCSVPHHSADYPPGTSVTHDARLTEATLQRVRELEGSIHSLEHANLGLNQQLEVVSDKLENTLASRSWRSTAWIRTLSNWRNRER